MFFFVIACRAASETVLVLGSLRSPHRAVPYDPMRGPFACTMRAARAVMFQRSIGDVITGEVRRPSAMAIRIGEDTAEAKICDAELDAEQRAQMKRLIDAEYRYSFAIENVTAVALDSGALRPGAKIGFARGGRYFAYTDFGFVVHLSKDGALLGIDVASLGRPTDVDSGALHLTYSVAYDRALSAEESRSRTAQSRVPQRAVALVALSALIAALIVAALLRSATDTESSGIGDEFEDISGFEWKLVHGDVCRAPAHPARLAAAAGWGAQAALAAAAALALGAAGRCSSGAALVAALAAAPAGGFVSGKLFKTIGARAWKAMALLAAALPPAVCVCVALAVGAVLRGSAAVVPLSALLPPAAADFALFFAGALVALKGHGFELAQKVNQLPRQIPPQQFGASAAINAIGGAVVFGSVLLACHVAADAMWAYRRIDCGIAYVAASAALLAAQSVMVGVTQTYYMLNKENYKWWWNAFRSGAVTGVFLAAYMVYYAVKEYAPFDVETAIVYTAVNLMICIVVSLVCGAFSFFGSFFFVQKIYNSLKVE